MKWHYTDGWNLDDFSTIVSISDDAELSANQKTPFVQVASSAASKTLTLGLGEGDCMILMNSGENAITVKNVSGDTGSSVAKGDIVLIVASETADATSVDVLNASGGGGGGGGGGGVLVCHEVAEGDDIRLDHTWQEISDAEFAAIYHTFSMGGQEYTEITTTAMIEQGDTYCLISAKTLDPDALSGMVNYRCDSASEYPALPR